MQAHNERLEAIKLRIAAALELAKEGSGASPAEAANAAAMASRLMRKYSLTEEQIRAAAGEQPAEYEQRPIRYSAQGVSRYLHAQIRLMHVLATYNFCDTVYDSGKKGRASGSGWIIGQAEHIDLVVAMYMRLMPQVLRMGQTAYVAYRNEKLGAGYWPDDIAQEASWRRNHFQGAVTAVEHRLKAEQAEAKASETPAEARDSSSETPLLSGATEGEQVTALIVLKDAALKEAVRRFVPDLKTARNTKVRDQSGYAAGYRDGHSLDIHQRKSVEG